MTTLQISPNGKITRLKPMTENAARFKQLQQIVGGHVEIVRTANPNVCIVVNENGKLVGLPFNPHASRTASILCGSPVELVGEVVISDVWWDTSEESELAEALDKYTNPNHPEYDAEFDKQIRTLRPDWFPASPENN